MNDELKGIDLGLKINHDGHELSNCFVHILGFSYESEFTEDMIFHVYGIYKSREKAIETITCQETIAAHTEFGDTFPFAIIESYAEEVIPASYEVTAFKWNSEVNKYVEIDFPGEITGSLTTSICLE